MQVTTKRQFWFTSRLRYVENRWGKALIEPFNSFNIFLTAPFHSNMYSSDNYVYEPRFADERHGNASCKWTEHVRCILVIDSSASQFYVHPSSSNGGSIKLSFVRLRNFLEWNSFPPWGEYATPSLFIHAEWDFRWFIEHRDCNAGVDFQWSDCRSTGRGCTYAAGVYNNRRFRT